MIHGPAPASPRVPADLAFGDLRHSADFELDSGVRLTGEWRRGWLGAVSIPPPTLDLLPPLSDHFTHCPPPFHLWCSQYITVTHTCQTLTTPDTSLHSLLSNRLAKCSGVEYNLPPPPDIL